jgi:protoporphyrinogen oxidase
MQMHIGVLGGGALGLTAAMRLARRGAKVTLIEKENELGGLAAGFEVGDSGTHLEKFYHHLFRSDKDIQALLTELGLGDKLTWHNVMTATLHGGKFWTLSPVQILLNYPISFPSRVRLGAVTALLKATGDYRRFKNDTAADWLKRWMGKEAYDMQFEPVLKGKFHHHAEEISMSWMWSRVHERSLDLGYLAGGFQQMYDRLGEEVKRAGGEILLGTAVTRIAPESGGRTRVETDSAGTFTFDSVVSTLPTKLFLRLTEGLPEDYREKYDWGDALGAHVVILSLNHRLFEKVYWLSIGDPDYPFLVAVDHTNMRDPSEYGGRHLAYLGNYLPMSHRYFSQSDDETIAEFIPAIKRISPEFDESWIQEKWVFKAPFAQPVVTREYEEHIAPLKTPLPNVYMGNMFQVYPQDRGQNYSIRLANRLSAMVPVEK